ncbi:MAG: HAD-IA family hydrolase [Candidatus Woesearchaeota archaeon]
MIKAIIFDLDNTLVNFWKMKTMSMEAATFAMRDAGLRMPKEKVNKIFEDIYHEFGTEYDLVFQEFLKKSMGKIDWKILANAIVGYRKMQSSHLEPYPGVMSTLIKLKEQGIKLGIASDAPRLRGWLRLVTMRLDPFFDAIVFFEDTKKLKPDREPFMKALRQMGIGPKDAMMVGDHFERDIVGAKKLGMLSCHAKYGHIEGWSGKLVKGCEPDYEISYIDQLLKIVEKENSR